jgi:hypothetical protein
MPATLPKAYAGARHRAVASFEFFGKRAESGGRSIEGNRLSRGDLPRLKIIVSPAFDNRDAKP